MVDLAKIMGLNMPKAKLFSGLEVNLPVVESIAEGSLFLCTDANYYYEVVAGAWVKKFSTTYYKAVDATLADFQANAATGTVATPERLNDNNTGTSIQGAPIGEYAEVDFGKVVKIDQWRQFGDANNTGDGSWKLQYKDVNGDWQDWVTGIATRAAASWSGMASESEVTTFAIRLVVTAVDTGLGENFMGELEVFYS